MHISTIRHKGIPAAIVAAILVICLMALPMQPARAATAVPIEVTTSSTGGEVVDGNRLFYHSDRNNTDDPYQIRYQGTLDMTQVWSNYQLLRIVYIVFGGNTEAQWQNLVMVGEWEIGFDVDPSRVSVDPTFLTAENLNNTIIAQNPGTAFPEYMRAYEVTYDQSSGQYRAKFRLEENGTPGVRAETLDNSANRPASLTLTTPANALFVTQEDFEVGESFTMTNAFVRGELDITTLFVPQLPLTFDSTGADVTITMVDSYSASYRYQATAGAPDLPQEILDTLPATQSNFGPTQVVTSSSPTTTSVETRFGTWTFQGWEPATHTIADADVEFLGTWGFTAAAPAPAVLVNKSADPATGTTVAAGETVGYTVTITNTGNVVVDEVIVIDDLQGVILHAELVESSLSSSIGPVPQVANGALTWEGPLAVDEVLILSYQVVIDDDVTESDSIVNQVTVSGSAAASTARTEAEVSYDTRTTTHPLEPTGEEEPPASTPVEGEPPVQENPVDEPDSSAPDRDEPLSDTGIGSDLPAIGGIAALFALLGYGLLMVRKRINA